METLSPRRWESPEGNPSGLFVAEPRCAFAMRRVAIPQHCEFGKAH